MCIVCGDTFDKWQVLDDQVGFEVRWAIAGTSIVTQVIGRFGDLFLLVVGTLIVFVVVVVIVVAGKSIVTKVICRFGFILALIMLLTLITIPMIIIVTNDS